MFTFAFMHYPYLVRILLGMPSLHLLTFLMFFFLSLVFVLFLMLTSVTVTVTPKPKKNISFKCNYNSRT